MTKRYPFKFLDAYNKADTDIFFGRDEEVEALYQMAFQSDILLVYGASGTGKTSLINCGLASRFQAHDWLALNIRRGSDINLSLQQKLDEATAGAKGTDSDLDLSWLDEEEEETAGSPLSRQIQDIYRRYFRPVYLIFDQFEELYVLGSKAEQARFIQSVQEIQSVGQPVKMIFVIREEYLGHLFEFERAVPQLLRKKLRVEPMNLDKVGQVIRGAAALESSNIRLAAGQEDAIVEGIFQKIRGDAHTLAIQLPYLQVFLDKLYLHVTGDEARQADALFTPQALAEIGDIGDVLRNFLEEQAIRIQKALDEKYPKLPEDAVWQILSPLATLEGTKEPMLEESLLQRLAHLPAAAVRAGLQALDQSRILRYDENESRYEVAHDSLAARIAEHRNDDEIAMLEIRRLITSQMALKAEARALFTERQLNLIEPYVNKLGLEPGALQLIKDSRKEVAAAARRKAVIISALTIISVGAIAASVVAIFFSIKANAKTKETVEALAEAEKQKNRSDSLSLEAQKAEKNAYIALASADEARKNAEHSDSLAQIERGKALTAQQRAEQQAREAKASALAAKARQIYTEDPTKALNLAAAGYRLSPNEESSAALRDILDNRASRFYYKKRFLGHSSNVWSATFSPDGQYILTGSADKTAKLWNRQGELLRTFQGHSGPVTSVAFSPDGQYILTGSADETAKLWNRQGELLHTFQVLLTGGWPKSSGPFSVTSVAFSPDGQYILTGGSLQTAKLWNRQGELLHAFQIPGEGFSEDHLGRQRYHYVSSVAFSPDGQSILVGSSDKTATLLTLQGEVLHTFQGHSGPVTSVAFSPDGQYILTGGSYDNTAILWSCQGELLHTFQGHSGPVTSVAFSPDGQYILTGSDDKTAILWSRQGEVLRTFLGHSYAVSSVAFSPDGQSILTGSDDKTAILWSRQGEVLHTFQGHSADVRSVAFSPDGQSILTGSFDKTAKLWNRKGQLLRTFQGHSDWVGSVAFSPDGQYILTGSSDNSAILWSRQGVLLHTFQGFGPVLSVAFSPDGQFILTGSDDKTAILWSRQGEKKYTFYGHSANVRSVAFSPDGQSILTGSSDKTAILWHNFYGELGQGAVWKWIEQLSAEEQAAYGIDWAY